MPFIIGIKIIAVNDAHRVVELQPVLEAQSAPGVAFQHPAGLHLRPDPGRDLHVLSGRQEI